MENSNALHLKYRPKKWDDVIGQEGVCKSLQKALKDGRGRSFLLIGPSGVGKTTIARLIAAEVGADPDGHSYLEFDAGTNTGVESIRDLQDLIRYKTMEGAPRVLCLDEAHMLSKSAWNALLKPIEEPPPGVYWIFCTTEGNKVPRTIRTRCLEYTLSGLNDGKLILLLDSVALTEGLSVSDDIIDLCVDKAQGSPREGLTALALVAGAADLREAEIVLQEPGKNADVIELCRAIMKGASWKEAMGIVNKIENLNPEGVRNVVVAYFSKVAMSGKDLKYVMDVLDAFRDPYPPGNAKHCLLLSLYAVIE